MKNCEEKLIEGITTSKKAFCGPKIAQVDLTGFCNNKCIGCWVHSPFIKKPPKDKNVSLPFELAKNLIKNLASLGTEEIFLSGAGEPFLYPQIFEILELIKKNGMKCNIITNFSLVDEQKASMLIDLKVDLVTASIWAGTDEIYIKMHPEKTEEDFCKLKDSLKTLTGLKKDRNNSFPQLKIYNVICNQNYFEIDKMIDFAKDIGAEIIEFQVMDIIDGVTSHLALSKEEVNKLKKQFADLGKREDLYFKEIGLSEFASFYLPETKEIAKEFPGRFLKIPPGFSVKEIEFKDEDGEDCAVRMVTCPKGITPKPTETNPLYKDKESVLIFKFPLSICRECSLYKKSCSLNKKGQLSIKFLKILGYDSFMRRLNSENIYDHSYDRNIVDKIPCYVGWNYSRVLSTGEVIPCCKAYKFPLGNLHKDDFSKIWFSQVYNIFREKAKNEKKSNRYFSLIDCYKCCDNLGMNLATHEMCGGHSLSKDIIISADSFSSGTLNASDCNFGKGIVVDGGFDYGFAQYKVDFPKSGRYSLWSYYATGKCRPVDIFMDGIIIKKNGMNQVTGGWDEKSLRWFKELDLDIRMGRHIFKIHSAKLIPHIRAFTFKPALKKEVHPGIKEEEEKKEVSSTKIQKSTQNKLSGNFLFPRRIYNYFSIKKIKDNYLDILGICNGRYAFKGPFHVQIDLTNNCNNNCIGCWCNSPLLEDKALSPTEKRQVLPLGLVKGLLDELASMGTREIYYSGGGEPFTHPDIMQVLEYSKRKGFICYVNTNFTLLDKERLRKLINLGIEHLTVSTWAATPEIYAATHPNKTEETFCQIKDNLKFLNQTKFSMPYVKLYNVIFKLNYHEIEEMIKFARETGSESVEFTVIDTIPGKTDRLLLNDEQCGELYERCQQIKSQLDKNGYLNGVRLFRFDQFLRRISSPEDFKRATYDRNIIDEMPCYIGWLFARIMPDGNVNSCLKSHRIPVGNLFQESFSEIWNGKQQIDFRKKTLVYKKSDSFFRLIGNDPDIQEAGCYKSCDDIGRNTFMHNKMKVFPNPVKIGFKIISNFPRLHLPFLNKKNTHPDPVIRGILDGRRAFAGPEQVVIDPTNKCNLRCSSCWLYSPWLTTNRPSPDWLNKELSKNVLLKLIDDLAGLGTKRIRFTGGGEPFMHKDFMEIIEHTRKKNLLTAITTNFGLVSKENIEKLLDLGLEELCISIWASNPETYCKTHHGISAAYFGKLKNNLNYLKEIKKGKPIVTFANVIMNNNFRDFKGMYEFGIKYGANKLYFTLPDLFSGQTDKLSLNDEEREELLRSALIIKERSKKDNIQLEFFKGFLRRLSKPIEHFKKGEYDKVDINKIPCYVGWIFSRILADGKVSPCCRGVNLPMGNISEQSFKEIWHSERYNEFRYRAKYSSKSAPYFDKIGCEKICDNFMHNEAMHKIIKGYSNG